MIVKDNLGNIYEVKIDTHNVKIIDSYRAKGKDAKMHVINEIISISPNAFANRSMSSILHEWKAHNILYKWNYEPERTRDVDIDDGISLLHRICFFILCIFPE